VTVTNDEQLIEETAEMDDTAAGVDTTEEQLLTVEEQLVAAQAEAARNLDGWQRTQAEFANARKRFEKQRVDTYVNANAELVAKLLPVFDDLERAIESAPADTRDAPWVAGVNLVYRKMLGVLEDMNVQAIPAVGEAFDPNLHEALSQEPSEDYESGVIMREMRRGYRLGDRVIRPSLVTVAA
jgi:molecular chaperone GrpE